MLLPNILRNEYSSSVLGGKSCTLLSVRTSGTITPSSKLMGRSMKHD